MKKAIMILSLIIVLLTLVSCKTKYWEFEYYYTDIKEIKIAYCESSKEYYTIKNIDISLAEEVYNDIKSLEMKSHGINRVEPGGQSFIIIYNDGNYDVIADNECNIVRYDEDEGRLGSYSTYLEPKNSEDFYILIEKYLDNSVVVETESLEEVSPK